MKYLAPMETYRDIYARGRERFGVYYKLPTVTLIYNAFLFVLVAFTLANDFAYQGLYLKPAIYMAAAVIGLVFNLSFFGEWRKPDAARGTVRKQAALFEKYDGDCMLQVEIYMTDPKDQRIETGAASMFRLLIAMWAVAAAVSIWSVT